MESTVLEKAEDVLNELVYQYNLDAKNDKSEVSRKTVEFINERLENVGGELAIVDDNVKNFKKKNSVTDIQSEAQLSTSN